MVIIFTNESDSPQAFDISGFKRWNGCQFEALGDKELVTVNKGKITYALLHSRRKCW